MRVRIQRAKTVGTDTWVEGTYFPPENTIIVHEPGKLSGAYLDYVVVPKTVGDYTGVVDKHNTRIFEGDIIRVDKHIKPLFGHSIGVVRYISGSFCIASSDSLFGFPQLCWSDEILRGEVIGNIYDNPELLEDSICGN